MAGREIAGRYLLVRALAKGGMAQVWLAEDLVMDRLVAVKILHPHFLDDRDVVRRFRAEAVANLRHRNIVAVLDDISEYDIEAIVMELVQGLTLRRFLDRYGRLSVQDTVDLSAQVADALEVAHEAGIVHRDIKPANILLTKDRTVKVADFGIAKELSGNDHTATGVLLGTAKYLAPEQVEGTQVDQRADIYALGVVVYEALCGQAPFEERTDSATALARLRRDPTTPRNLGVDLPDQVEAVVLKALARDRNDRYDSIAEFRDRLIDAASGRVLPDGDKTRVISDADLDYSSYVDPVVEPDFDEDYTEPRRSRWGRRLVLLAVILGSFGLGIGLIAGTGVGSDFFRDVGSKFGFVSPNDNSANLSLAPIPVNVRDFDPQGDEAEHPELVAFASDNEVGTRWHTESYNSRSFAGLKEGVGLIFELERTTQLGWIEIVSPTEDWSAEIYIDSEVHGNLQRWGEPQASLQGVSGNQIVQINRNTRYVLLWVTDLGNAEPRARFDLMEFVLHR